MAGSPCGSRGAPLHSLSPLRSDGAVIEAIAFAENLFEIRFDPGVDEQLAKGLAPGTVPGEHASHIEPMRGSRERAGVAGQGSVHLRHLIGVMIDGGVEGAHLLFAEHAAKDQVAVKVEKYLSSSFMG